MSVRLLSLFRYATSLKINTINERKASWKISFKTILFFYYRSIQTKKGKGSPYSITERRVPELIPVIDSQPAGDVSHKPGGRLPLLSARTTVTLATLKRAATNFAASWTEARCVWTVCLRQPGFSAPASSTLTTRLPSHPTDCHPTDCDAVFMTDQ